MRKIMYKKRTTPKDRRKLMSIIEHSEDKECKTYVRKNFTYIVTIEEKVGKLSDPEIFITKFRDEKTKLEKFSFRVKGTFYLTTDECIAKVRFCHKLNIVLKWKSKALFPKPVTPP